MLVANSMKTDKQRLSETEQVRERRCGGGPYSKYQARTGNGFQCAQRAGDKNPEMTKTPATLAKQIERAMVRAAKDCCLYKNEHCTLSEPDLEYICPRNDKERKKKLVEFAAQYGFRLRFYRKGLFAIFGKRTPPVANDPGGLWPSLPWQASSPN
jgi:hypothetical protein